ncbi:PIN domain-containing protein [Corynebacterium aquatimens]|uniref:type II toxin-antitoxin system VapC family toxin n=1 Tax=Corynebacterium TaxID=1716 RepID=UPI001F2CF83E|nr:MULTISPECIES: PIN domain-containing protein [Corynebacterium]QYH19461.1 PIN domain-containing protein [Corynebacterium aquatimens]UIZ91622.1 PIN domain-containing protein [Corynebacterium sp. CNCTC7651]
MAHREKPVRVAIDSCLFISLFLDEDESLNDRTEAVLGYDGYEIVLSTLVGIEAVGGNGMRQGANAGPINTEEIQAARYFFDNANVLWMEVNRRVMLRARDYCTNLLIKPPDATVLACAVESGCKHLFTNDRLLIKRSESIPEIEIGLPPELSFFPGEEKGFVMPDEPGGDAGLPD